jgi:hypothetical protein
MPAESRPAAQEINNIGGHKMQLFKTYREPSKRAKYEADGILI